jgi:hypothetical protein
VCPPSADLFLGVAAASVIGWMGFLAVHQFAIAACWRRFVVCFFRAILVQVAASAVEVDYSLPIHGQTFDSYSIAILVSVCLHLNRYVAKARQFENILGFLSPRESYKV